MKHIVVEPFPTVKVGIMESLPPNEIDCPPNEIDWNGYCYKHVIVSDDFLVFYDWVRNSSGRIVGLEIYIWEEHSPLRDLCSTVSGRPEGAVRLSFLPNGSGAPDATQGFGDIYFYRSPTGRWLIVVGTELWLMHGDIEWVEQIALTRK